MDYAYKYSQCDKFGATIKLENTFYGFYGDSSCRRWSDEDIEWVKQAIQCNWGYLFNAAMKEAEREMESARQEAEAEAREVLAQTQKS